MQNRFEVASAALLLLGESPVSSFGGSETPQVALTALYENTVEAALTHPWRFSMTTVTLNRLAGTPASAYAAAYQLPSEPKVLAVRAVRVDDAPVTDFDRYEDELHLDASLDAVVRADVHVRMPEASWPPDFTEAVIYVLASKLAIPVAEDDAKLQLYAQLGEQRMRLARSRHAMQQKSRSMHTSRFIRTRNLP